MRTRVTSLYIYPDSESPGQELDRVDVTPEGPEGNRAKKHAVHLVAVDEFVETHPKANIVLDVDAATLAGLVGKAIRLGHVTLSVTQKPAQCAGVYAEVLEPGSLAVGDELLVETES
jgi:hypothetical protein